MSQWKTGQPLKDGKYIVQELLGSGGFGVTYRAIEQPSGKLVAIKTLNALQQSKPDFEAKQEKFINEAMCLARCSHRHIVRVYTLFQEDGLWCMVMEYIEGMTLAEYLYERGTLSEDEALRYIRQIGEALTYVHDQEFLHRDVKPANIILRQDSLDAVLIDFGLAREFTHGRTQSLTNLGTEGFAPIEQYERRGKFGAYTDVYALAATLYTLLSYKQPIPAKYRKEGNIPLVPPKQHNPRISDRVNDAILKGMALEAKDRPQSVQEWLLTLPLFPQLQVFHFEVVTVDRLGNITQRRQHQAQYFVEDLGNGVSLEMVAIPGGTFLMGSPETEEERSDRESPQHKVTISSFYMGKYPVTQAQWKAVAALPQVYEPLEPELSYFKGAKRPVECVSWDDAVEFCTRLSRKTGRNYRLPSEAEWEYACRAGTTTPFHFGETITPDLANYNGVFTYSSGPKGVHRQETTPVGSFQVANAFGLYDMHGNVWEWCADSWHDNYQGAPSDGRVWDDNHGEYRLLRGGPWPYIPLFCRSARRDGHAPGGRRSNNGIGFRVVCAVEWTP